MPEDEYKHLRVRPPEWFSRFRVLKKRSHLDPADRKKVQQKIGSKRALYTVGKFKRQFKAKAPKGKKGEPLAWALQKIMLKKPKGGKKRMGKKSKPKKGKKTKKQQKKEKWGKIGAPDSEKRKKHMKKIRGKRGKKK